MKNCRIVCAHKYIPERKIDNDEMSRMVDTSDEWIVSRTGIKERHISTGENTSYMAGEGLKGLIEKSGISPLDIDLLIVATISPDYLTPSTACLVQHIAGAKNAFAFDVNAACSGFVYALSTAEKFISSGKYKTAAVIGADILSKMIDFTDRSTCVLFGDGAGGVLLQACEENHYLSEDMNSCGDKAMALYGGHMPVDTVFSKEQPNMGKYIKMNGREIFDFTLTEVPESIKRALSKAEVDLEDIDYIVPHQANARIVNYMAKKLSIDVSRFFINIDQYGNTTAASIPIALSDMLEEGKIEIGSGKKLALVGFGGGLTWGTVIIKI
ncbi:MAG TPA: 3-oxoacyl-ACP synthase [Clostridiales bacterium]|nr:3-oxoacyl-ACP synthase [Clostridiales bacterium]